MNPNEFEENLNDLETRVDRLRALYENWFRGYEKMEPQVARKDVERRVYGLRKELPRNTALRFRYHQLYQRYTTLSTYWARTARQIEEGTYRLQLQRFRRKQGRAGQEDEATEHKDKREGKERPQSYELNADESLSIEDLLNDLEMDEVARAVDAPSSKSEPAPARATFAKPRRLSSRPPARGVVPLMKESSRSSAPPPSQAGKGARKNGFLDDDLDLPTGLHLSLEEDMSKLPRPSAPQKPSAPTLGRPSAATQPSRPSAPNGAVAPAPLASASHGAPASPAPSAPRASVPGVPPPPPFLGRPSAPGAPPLPPGRPSAPGTPALPPAVAARPSGGAPQAVAGAQASRPAPSEALGSAARSVPTPPGREPPKLPPRPSAALPAQSGNTIVGRPPQASPLAGTQAGRPSASGPLPEQHMQRIYNEYVAARRKNNEGDVRYEALVSSIQKMMPDLQKKHAGKKIDFEVVVKDGRVGLKPKAT